MSTPHAIDLAVIGGSGLYKFPGLENVERSAVETPWGAASGDVVLGDFAGKRVAFLARHGESHSLPPHRVNYRANLWALHGLGARTVIGVNAVGGIRTDMGPRAIVVPEAGMGTYDFSAAPLTLHAPPGTSDRTYGASVSVVIAAGP